MEGSRDGRWIEGRREGNMKSEHEGRLIYREKLEGEESLMKERVNRRKK